MPVIGRSTPSAVTVKAATAAADSVPVPDGKSFCHWSTTDVPTACTVAAESVGRSRVTVTV